MVAVTRNNHFYNRFWYEKTVAEKTVRSYAFTHKIVCSGSKDRLLSSGSSAFDRTRIPLLCPNINSNREYAVKSG